MLVQQVSFKSSVVSNQNQQKVDSRRISKNIVIDESDKFENKKQKNKKGKKAALIGITIGLLTIAGAIIAHKINSKPKSIIYDPLNFLFNGPKDEVQVKLHNIFTEIKDLKGEQFINKAYEHIIDFYDYKSCAPEIKFVKNLRKDCTVCGYRPISGIIEIDSFFLRNNSQTEALQSLWHEFVHFMQYSDIMRTKGIGIEGFIKAKARYSAMNSFKNKKACLATFDKTPEQLTEAEKDDYINLLVEGIKKKTNISLYRRVIKYKGIINKNNEMARETQDNLQAALNYESATSFSDKNYGRYRNNLLERYAYRTDEYIGKLYVKFLNSAKAKTSSPWE